MIPPHTILPRKVVPMIATNKNSSSNATSPNLKPKIPTILNTIRNYFDLNKTNNNIMKYPNSISTKNNNNNVNNHSKTAPTTSETTLLIKKIKKCSDKKTSPTT